MASLRCVNNFRAGASLNIQRRHTATFDLSSGPLLRNVNMKPAGAQSALRDTSRFQKMVYSTHKGKLTEQGVDTTGMRLTRSFRRNDFKYERTKVEHMVINRGYHAIIIRKFHCNKTHLLGPCKTLHKEPL